MNGLKITFQAPGVYSLAAQQNAYRLFSSLNLSYPMAVEGAEDASPTLRDVTVRLTDLAGRLQPETWVISQLAPGQHVRLQDRPLKFDHAFLLNLSDETQLEFEFQAFGDGVVPLAVASTTVTVLPANFWGGETRQPELLAAFVKPNGVYVESLVRQVADVMNSNGLGRAVDGYQSNTRERPYAMAAALWSVVAAQNIAYVSPPPSYAQQGQLIRLASDISNSKMGACLDLSLLFASCLELMGLNTVVALTETHAVVGVWLIDTMFPLLTNDDPVELRKRVDAKDLVLFESTMVTNDPAPTFLQSCARARSLIAEESVEPFVYAIDIAQARTQQIKPLATVEERAEEKGAGQDSGSAVLTIPALPKVRVDEQVREETPETRIDGWQRRLLDLTKRNPLLAFKDRSVGIRVFCPDIGQLEDQLADGDTFSFVSAETSPVNERERSTEVFRLATGNDLHENYALEQLAKKKLVANMSEKRLNDTAVALFRKARTDLEEGGANTLFLALGMLAWRENPEDDRVFKAPLILIPVELSRKSARAPVKLRQLPDEDPLFNLTLIEFLQSEHAINIGHLRENLPEDESGLDVARIWQDVREAIAEQKGFEVLEECTIASFSFAKYLMWKDLRDRIEDLKQNPFVAHLVDRPTEAYGQAASFLKRHEVDQKIDPSELFTPLNCDSSQMVAVEASGKPQDFVLEGPPGTGKSETIANIIAHNLAKGRKVLFVAEKIAALQVVYRRLEKIGLDHLALELHSNKANKRAVLDQLRRATEERDARSSARWLEEAKALKARRDELNAFVRDLHTPSAFGITPRQAISTVSKAEASEILNLPWGIDLDNAPIKGETGYKNFLAAAKQAGIAFGDLRDADVTAFSLVTAQHWSYAWQDSFLTGLREFVTAVKRLEAPVSGFGAQFNVERLAVSGESLGALEALAALVSEAEREAIIYGVSGEVQARLSRLSSLAEDKKHFDKSLSRLGHGATAEKLLNADLADWVREYESTKESRWKAFFARRRVNKAARSAGFEKFDTLEPLPEFLRVRGMAGKITGSIEEFEALGLWTGWDTAPEVLSAHHERGVEIHALLSKAMGLVDDPLTLLTAVKSKLIDGREFLSQSKVVGDKHALLSAIEEYRSAKTALVDLGVALPESEALESFCSRLERIAEQENRLKNWVDWAQAREALRSMQGEVLCEALEAGRISFEEVVPHANSAFCRWLAYRLIDSRSSLRSFKASDHNAKLEAFRALDARVAETTSEHIANLLAAGTPDIKSKEHAPSFGSLARELQKKTRHKPIRALFEDMGERLLDLVPCLMMSPLSVAQFLPSDFNAFDLVVFDEASQITTWDAVGAIARGKNVIVVGDPKQMPPTNFFNKPVDSDDPDEEDLESILDQALAAGLPHLRLTGHYRSRHETLIAFSNNKYYDNALVTYPSAETKQSAVSLRRVEGVYAKGKARNNPEEAKAVVQEVVQRLMDPQLQKLTLGIVTLNAEQQKTIEDFLDTARRQHPDIEPFFHGTEAFDPVFVKNLEAVQGDERDVILFSLGYGPTAPGASTMSMNFGPLNKQGGERRLNVAITRATTEVVLFSSFDSSMIDLSRTSATAVEHLKHYMEFAERGPAALAEQNFADYGVDQFDSAFEEAVAWALRNRGWKVQTQVGVSKFRVDLGIVHPDHPGRYLAGVECDGATYHGSPSARDRDRTRHAILEHLGWKLVRLWSTDYFRDPETALELVHERLTQLLEEDREGPAEAPGAKDTVPASINVAFDSAADMSATAAADEPDESSETIAEGAEYPASIYFEPSHEPVLVAMAKEILTERPCITQKALALEIANRHGKNKTSKKQLQHLSRLIDPWAGILQFDGHPPVYWPSPGDVRDVVSWRGLDPFGYERDWSELAYPEAIGLAKEAIEQRPGHPVGYICDTFKLKRRAVSTLATFADWVAAAKAGV